MDNYNYHPGTDTASAPWNELPELEPTAADFDEAKNEVWFLMDWTDNQNPECSFNQILEMLYNACPNDYFDVEFCTIIDAMKMTEQDHGTTEALNLMPQANRDQIKAYAESYIEERAMEIARDVDTEDYRF